MVASVSLAYAETNHSCQDFRLVKSHGWSHVVQEVKHPQIKHPTNRGRFTDGHLEKSPIERIRSQARADARMSLICCVPGTRIFRGALMQKVALPQHFCIFISK